MRATTTLFLMTVAAVLSAAPLAAQRSLASAGSTSTGEESANAGTIDTIAAGGAKRASLYRQIEIQNFRPLDQRGLNVFEAPKAAPVPWAGFKLHFGAAFTQQLQGLDHDNTAEPVMSNGVNVNQLMDIGAGFNNATANLYVDAQLAPGIRVALSSYLSSRHHNDTWVKDGYLLMDESPIEIALFEDIMKYVTLRLGHFEVNYGDAHFRRSDNGNALFNPFVGNFVLDAFTTEVGGEVYVRHNGFMAMLGMTNGEIRGNTARPADRDPSVIAKLGVDRQLDPDLRVRLTGSGYYTKSSASNTLYSGDRAGSRYYNVMENTTATESANFRSGLINPAFGDAVTALMINPFVKYRGVELFGLAEHAEGRGATETADRTWNQYAADIVYRFLPGEQAYVAGRYNTASGELLFAGAPLEVGVDRWALGAGWFITPGILMKGEYVTQKYNDFPTTDIRNGGKFNGFVLEGVVAF